jgi:hypothetical protein
MKETVYTRAVLVIAKAENLYASGSRCLLDRRAMRLCNAGSITSDRHAQTMEQNGPPLAPPTYTPATSNLRIIASLRMTARPPMRQRSQRAGTKLWMLVFAALAVAAAAIALRLGFDSDDRPTAASEAGTPARVAAERARSASAPSTSASINAPAQSTPAPTDLASVNKPDVAFSAVPQLAQPLLREQTLIGLASHCAQRLSSLQRRFDLRA